MSAPARRPPATKKQKEWDFFSVSRERVKLARKDRRENSRISGTTQYALIDHLTNLTFANARKPGAPPAGAVALTNVQVCREIGCSEPALLAAIKDGVARGLFEVYDHKEAKRRGYPPSGHPQAKWYELRPENWATAERYSPPKAELVVMPDPEDVGDPEDEADDEPLTDDPAQQDVQVEPRKPIFLRAGAKSKPVPWVPAAKKYSFDCSRVQVGLSIEPRLSFGVVQFKLIQQVVEETPKVDLRGGVNTRVAAKPTAGSPGEPPPAIAPKELIAELAKRHLAVAPDQANKIIAILKDGRVPLPYFLEELDDQREAASKKGNAYRKAWLSNTARDAAGSFPAYQRIQQLGVDTPKVGLRGGVEKKPASSSGEESTITKVMKRRMGVS